jgi:hypothetical protein
MTIYKPGTYTKGEDVRHASSPSEAVALVFAGYRPQTAASVAESADYRDLQAQAKGLGIPANQSKADLAQAIAEAPVAAPSAPVSTPDFPEPQSMLDGESNADFDADEDVDGEPDES